MGGNHMREGTRPTLARQLRKDMTEAERALWRVLRLTQLGVKFRRQHPIGPYIVDFVCLASALVVEVDGGQHLDSPHDATRDQWLTEHGYRVRRYWNDEVLTRIDDVVADIVRALEESRPHPNLPPQAGEGEEL